MRVFQGTYAVPRWLVWLACVNIAIGGVAGIYDFVGWFS